MKQEVTITCRMTHASFSIKIKEVHELNNQLVVISRLKGGGYPGDVMDNISDSISVTTSADAPLPVKHYVIISGTGLSKTHSACKARHFTAIERESEIKEAIDDSTSLYKGSTKLARLGLHASQASVENNSATTSETNSNFTK